MVGSDGIPRPDASKFDEMTKAMLMGLLGTPSGGSGIGSLKSLSSNISKGVVKGKELVEIMSKWGERDTKGLLSAIDKTIVGLGRFKDIKGLWKSPTADSLYKRVGRFHSQWGGATVSATNPSLSTGTVFVQTVAGSKTKIMCSAEPPEIVADGVKTSTITAKICDQYGNTVTDATDLITFSISGICYCVTILVTYFCCYS